MDWKHLVLPFVLLAVCPLLAQDSEQHQRAALASVRLIAAHKLPNITSAQCSAVADDWLQRDSADRNSPYWFELLSTEELVRSLSLAVGCADEGIHREGVDRNESRRYVGMFVSRQSQFQSQLLSRAETVLRNHGLIEDYLLQP